MSQVEGSISLHRDWFIDFARILLGIVLILKGIYFLQDMGSLMQLSPKEFETELGSGWAYGTLAHFIIFVHILGGVAVAVGFLTRLVIPIQFPVILIALFAPPLAKIYFPAGTATELLMLVVLMAGIMVYGSGRISIDYYLRNKKGNFIQHEDPRN